MGKMQATRANQKDNLQAEAEANCFSGAYLMPELLFKKEWESSRGDVERMSIFFDVSLVAVQTRAIFLKLVDKEKQNE
jgi:Zn-dependent peptidase ImmA (M78 family)